MSDPLKLSGRGTRSQTKKCHVAQGSSWWRAYLSRHFNYNGLSPISWHANAQYATPGYFYDCKVNTEKQKFIQKDAPNARYIILEEGRWDGFETKEFMCAAVLVGAESTACIWRIDCIVTPSFTPIRIQCSSRTRNPKIHEVAFLYDVFGIFVYLQGEWLVCSFSSQKACHRSSRPPNWLGQGHERRVFPLSRVILSSISVVCSVKFCSRHLKLSCWIPVRLRNQSGDSWRTMIFLLVYLQYVGQDEKKNLWDNYMSHDNVAGHVL